VVTYLEYFHPQNNGKKKGIAVICVYDITSTFLVEPW